MHHRCFTFTQSYGLQSSRRELSWLGRLLEVTSYFLFGIVGYDSSYDFDESLRLR